MTKYKLVFREGQDERLQIFFVNEYTETEDFITFFDANRNLKITYNKSVLIKIVEEQE